MSEKAAVQSFPRRDEHGRAVSLRELVFAAVGSLIIALVGLLVIDGVLALFGLASFASAPGWLSLILPALIFFDDLRGWKGYAIRFAVAFVAGVTHAAPLVSGAVGALVAVLVYSPAWFFGVRWSTGQHSEMGSS
jgi:hypothetical protein